MCNARAGFKSRERTKATNIGFKVQLPLLYLIVRHVLLLILKLFFLTQNRRSHSQDVFAVSDLSPTQLQDTFGIWTQHEETTRHKNATIHTVEEHPDENESEAYERFSHTPSSAHLRASLTDPLDDATQKIEQICINDLDEPDDEDHPRRRGKKRKKSKTIITHTFQASQDPETHIATLAADDSQNASARPSFSIPYSTGSMQLLGHIPRATFEIVEEDNSEFFLDEESLKLLRRGLNIDIVEEVFDRYVRKRFTLSMIDRVIMEDQLVE